MLTFLKMADPIQQIEKRKRAGKTETTLLNAAFVITEIAIWKAE